MEFKPKARTHNNLLVIEVKDDSGKLSEVNFTGTRVGLSWPNSENTGGYFVMVGQEAKPSILGVRPLWIISEYKALTLDGLFMKMFNAMGLYGCFEIFSDVSDRYRSYIIAIDTYRRKDRNLQDIRLKEAPYADQFLKGNDTITKWIKVIKGLTIPKEFCIHSQLREIRQDDLDHRPEEKFFAINALRYVLEAFETSSIPEVKTRPVERGVPPGAWT